MEMLSLKRATQQPSKDAEMYFTGFCKPNATHFMFQLNHITLQLRKLVVSFPK